MKKLIVLSLLFSFAASAGVFVIKDRICNGSLASSGTTCTTAANDLFDSLENDINADLPDADASTYLPGMANAAIASGKSQSGDHSNDLDFMMVSANVGVGLDTGDQDLNDFISGDADANQVRGFGLNAAITIGLDLGILPVDKLGPIDLEKMDLFVSAMKLEEGKEGVDDQYAELTYFAVKARYHLYEGNSILPGGMLKWGGVYVSTGIEKSSLRMVLQEKFNETVSSGSVNATFNGTAKFGADIDVTSIPIEISTYVQTLYALTFYGGLGVDFNFGEATSIAGVTGSITAGSNPNNASATGDLNLGSTGEPESVGARGFFGLQIGVPLVKFYVQLNKQFTGDNVAGVGAGLKVIW